MKRYIFVITVLSLTSTTWAERNPIYKDYLTPERLDRWRGLSQSMNYTNLYTLMHEMYYLPETPFSEPLKQILLQMGTAYKELIRAQRKNEPVILPDKVARDRCGEISGNLYEMMSWQDDPRFIDFQANYAGGLLAARGLARIGEPAFDTVIKALQVEGYPSVPYSAAKTIELMMQKEDSFLRTDLSKHTIARNALMAIAHSNDSTIRIGVIDALRFFPGGDISDLLRTISLTDPRMVNGRYPLRARAQEALTFRNTRGIGVR